MTTPTIPTAIDPIPGLDTTNPDHITVTATGTTYHSIAALASHDGTVSHHVFAQPHVAESMRVRALTVPGAPVVTVEPLPSLTVLTGVHLEGPDLALRRLISEYAPRLAPHAPPVWPEGHEPVEYDVEPAAPMDVLTDARGTRAVLDYTYIEYHSVPNALIEHTNKRQHLTRLLVTSPVAASIKRDADNAELAQGELTPWYSTLRYSETTPTNLPQLRLVELRGHLDTIEATLRKHLYR